MRGNISRAELIASITELPLADIEVTEDRLRPVSMAHVEAIAASIQEHGLILPLVVRSLGKGRYELVDGGHRRAALEALDHDIVPVRCYRGPAPAIRLIEIDANLARADLSDLDRAIHLAARKREYLAEHPETAQGKAGAYGRWDATADLPLHSFVQMTVDQTGLNERRLRRYIEAGDLIDKSMAERLRGAKYRVTLHDLLALRKADPNLRPYAIDLFAEGKADKIAKAVKLVKAVDDQPVPVDKVEAETAALLKLWQRSSKAARDSFVTKLRDELLFAIEASGGQNG